MLFPLSKGFCSTRVFQTGSHHEPPRKTAYVNSNTDVENKTRDLHRLLHDRKPYEEHLELARSYAESQRQADAERAKNHAASIKVLNASMDERARQERAELRRRMGDFRDARQSRDEELRTNMRNTSMDFQEWRTGMQGRVNSLGKIWGGAPEPETEERVQQREDRRRNMKAASKKYLKDMDVLRRTLSDSVVKPYRGVEAEEAAEERKRAATAAMSQTARDWESHLESLYKKHDQRIRQVQRGHRERHLERQDEIEQERQALTMRFEATAKKAKAEITARDAKIASRPKGFAGYQPLEKSEKRLRVEKALQSDPNVAMMTATTLPRDATQTQRTLSPRTLGAETGAP
eukprot:TRINITY_DN47686_c0_g1_i1.p2 TRINITY_DN47686_c0_g1~~TRINITY_DN47686_c0_g1_i1.p2  ORF type:complete len:348 (-),score=85.08 TRINITY_DN47686_c0_g1_i1:44-1087(-)